MYPQIRDMIKRIPKLRGRGKQSFKSFQEAYTPVNLETLETAFIAGGPVSPETLLAGKVISLQSGKMPKVKILGRGAVTKAFIVSGCAISASAKASIEKAGGRVAV
jgi:large subunit ribosomal protein L15